MCAEVVCTDGRRMVPIDVTDHFNKTMSGPARDMCVSEYILRATRIGEQGKVALQITTMDLEEINLQGQEQVSSVLQSDHAAALYRDARIDTEVLD